MTSEQQKLVTDNYNLIYTFLNQHNQGNNEDLEQEMAIALCNAAKYYDKSKGAFSTLAFRCMNNKLGMLIRKENAPSRIPKSLICSLDKSIDDEGETGTSLLNLIGETDTKILNSNEENEHIKYFINIALTDNQKIYIDMFLKGYNQTEIAKKTGKSKQCVNQAILKIRRKYDYFKKHNYKYTNYEIKQFEKQKLKENKRS